MKKVIVWGYWVKNFGDDLFLKSLINNINNNKGNISIQICCKKKYREYYRKMGVKVFVEDSFFHKIINRILKVFNKPDLYFLKCKKENYFVMLGGSLFAENKSNEIEKNQLRNLNYAIEKVFKSYIIGSNFGPFKTDDFKKSYEKLFSKVSDISFRDKYSFELFYEKLKNIRYGLDIALEGVWDEYVNKKSIDNNIDNKCIAISMINLKKREELKKYKNDYEKRFIEICNYHIGNNEKILLLNFCEKEGDRETYNYIINKINNSKMIEIIEYSNIDSICNAIKKCKKIYATRFHAIMLGLYYNKNIVPFVYNPKSINALTTYSNNFFYYDLKNIKEHSVKELVARNQIIRIKKIENQQFSALLKDL